MKIFTIDDIRSIERLTAETQAIGEPELVMRMAEGVSGEIASRWRPSRRMVVFAGPGNNGADALAATRLLSGGIIANDRADGPGLSSVSVSVQYKRP